ncbi:hypothetical protein DH2020_025560 [Rehmannia glutinosa]|uniref:Histone acetyltransferase n=1 Tax=Rehmannia glutinosa TaxID=99300 RepID=A0ABR0W219_REHGL
MPRPGPRPYECVRRAWHSDRHQPIRGSLIQEIFRIVNEVHCSATRKNREWQEKLPIVVLKAEEIMYSKANSEAEYSDLKTLWDRVNDAINTIIRRDESTETGELLQPCIEAALHLGCTPRRSSRSQRNDSPRYYLRPETLEDTSVPNYNSNTKTTTCPLMLHYPQYSTLDTVNPLNSCLKADDRSIQNRTSNYIKKFPVLPKNVAPSTSSNTWSVYPLCHNNQIQPDGLKFRSLKPSNSSSHLMENDKLGLHQNFSLSDLICPSNHEGEGIQCDLTLRLGSLVAPHAGIEDNWRLQVKNGDRNSKKFKSHLVSTNEQ